ncbi:MAG: ABC transporter ATP-binding protein [Microthrixaceae bacterium]
MNTTTTPTSGHERTDGAPVALTMDGVGVEYRDGDLLVRALDAVDLEVHGGELVALVGPSGSGKSSLLAVAGALLTPTDGRVLLDGLEVESMGPAELAAVRRDHLGFIFQSGGLFPSLTAMDQLLLVDHVRGRRARPGGEARARELLAEMGLEDRADHRPEQLSGGERQRVAIARALMGRPALLLADEPTASLDRARSAAIMEVLATQTHRHGTATLVVTHDPEGLEHADRVLELVDGRLRD